MRGASDRSSAVVTGPTPTVEQATTLVRFDGARLLDSDGLLLAELAPDGRWYASDGAPCAGLELPAIRARPQVSHADRIAARQSADKVWMDAAHDALRELAGTHAEITSDDLWAALTMPPRESRMIGNALARAQSTGLFERTERHKPSTRSENHARPVRVWSSMRYGQQHVC